MAAVNDARSLAAILSDLCDDTDNNVLYILSVPKHYCKCIANNMNFNSALTIWMPPSCKLTTCRVTETAGIEAILIQKMRALSREHKVQLRIVPENHDLSQSAAPLKSSQNGLRFV